MAHPYHAHRESQRDTGHERSKAHGGRAKKPTHVSKHVHINVGSPSDLAGLAGGPGPMPPAGPMPAAGGPMPGGPAGGPMPMPPPGGMPPAPGAPPMKRGGKY